MSDFMMIDTNTSEYMRELQKQGAQRKAKDSLGKDDFLKILVAQLTHQDPTQPMEDREFIAQMAQFSSLEQMQNLNKEFSKVANLFATGQAVNLIGKTVDVAIKNRDAAGNETQNLISGRVLEVTGGDSPQLLVNGNYYDYAAVVRIREEN
jgi:flagellar basal-body rod modification protein FlgD